MAILVLYFASQALWTIWSVALTTGEDVMVTLTGVTQETVVAMETASQGELKAWSLSLSVSDLVVSHAVEAMSPTCFSPPIRATFSDASSFSPQNLEALWRLTLREIANALFLG